MRRFPDAVRGLPRGARCRDAHHRARPGLGDLPELGRSPMVGGPAVHGPRLRSLPALAGPRPSGAARRTDPARLPAHRPLPLHQHRDRRPGPGRRQLVLPAAGRDLPDADPAAGRHRDAGRRSDPARPRGLGRRPWRADGAPRQVRQIPPAAAALDGHRRPPGLPAPARPADASPAHRRAAAVHQGLPPALRAGLGHLPPADWPGRTDSAFAGVHAEDP